MNGIDIKIARIQSGIRQYELANAIGIPASVLSMIESGRKPLTPQKEQAIAAALERLSKGGAHVGLA